MRPFAAALLALAIAAPLRADDATKALLEKAVKAQGGADKAAKLNEMTIKGKGQFMEGGNAAEMSFDLSIKHFDHARFDMSVSEGGRSHKGVMVFAVDKAWFRDGDRDKVEPAPAEVVPILESVFLAIRAASSPGMLAGNKNLTLAHGGEAKIDDTPAEVLRISRKDKADVTIYFDKKTSLPLKSETTIKEPNGQEKPFSVNFSEFKELDGVKHFTKLKIHADKTEMEMELSELKLGAKFEANTFDKP